MNNFEIGLIYAGPVLGICAMAAGTVCLIVWRRYRRRADQRHSELQSMLDRQREECAQEIARLSRNVTVLEENAQRIEDVGWGGLTRVRRSQALQLLRSGMSPESAASRLGLGMREMRLISRVSRTLLPH